MWQPRRVIFSLIVATMVLSFLYLSTAGVVATLVQLALLCVILAASVAMALWSAIYWDREGVLSRVGLVIFLLAVALLFLPHAL